MANRQGWAVACFVIAAVFGLSALRVVLRGPAILEASGQGWGQAVGAFLPTVVFLVVGPKLMQDKPKPPPE